MIRINKIKLLSQLFCKIVLPLRVKVKRGDNWLTFTFFFFALSFSSCGDFREKEIHLIPKGYRGKVQIIFNTPTGEEQYENGKRLYRIPEGGVLRTPFKENYGFVPDNKGYMTFYYVDSEGRREELEFNPNHATYLEDSSKVQVYSFVMGTVGGREVLEYVVDSPSNNENYRPFQ